MEWPSAILLILSPAILYGLLLVATAISRKYYRRRCPKCSMRGLKSVNFIRATIVINGKRAPDSWSYYVCERCGAAFKLHHGRWLDVPEDEKHHLALLR